MRDDEPDGAQAMFRRREVFIDQPPQFVSIRWIKTPRNRRLTNHHIIEKGDRNCGKKRDATQNSEVQEFWGASLFFPIPVPFFCLLAFRCVVALLVADFQLNWLSVVIDVHWWNFDAQLVEFAVVLPFPGNKPETVFVAKICADALADA